MRYLLYIIGIVFSIALIKYRERVAELTGSADWMDWVGGVYNLIIVVAIFIFFFCVASLVGATDMFFAPLKWLLPMPAGDPSAAGF